MSRPTGKTPSAEILQYLAENFRYAPETGQVWRLTGMYGQGGYRRVEVSFGPRNDRERCNVSVHRLAWYLMTGEWPPDLMVVDHKNRVRDDNRWENLRLCSGKQNSWNRKARGEVGSRGVTFLRKRSDKPFKAAIGTWPNNKVIGYFETEQEASAAFEEEARERYGEFFTK